MKEGKRSIPSVQVQAPRSCSYSIGCWYRSQGFQIFSNLVCFSQRMLANFSCYIIQEILCFSVTILTTCDFHAFAMVILATKKMIKHESLSTVCCEMFPIDSFRRAIMAVFLLFVLVTKWIIVNTLVQKSPNLRTRPPDVVQSILLPTSSKT